MTIVAQLYQGQPSRRRVARAKLRLEVTGQSVADHIEKVLIHDISLTGLLIETSSQLPLQGFVEVELPQAGSVEAEVVWTSGQFFGCRFKKQISKAALSAALLRAEPTVSNKNATAPAQNPVAELRELSARVHQLGLVIDRLLKTESSGLAGVQLPNNIRASSSDRMTSALSPTDDRFSLPTRLRVLVGLSIGMWALILWLITSVW